jgi:hypothetical protein
MKPNIFKVLDISSMHIPKVTADALGSYDSGKANPSIRGLVIVDWRGANGWLISSTALGDLSITHYVITGHRNLSNILQLALELKCDYIKLHADGTLYSELEQFDW